VAEIDYHEGLDLGLIDELVELYRNEWWTADRDRRHVEPMLAGSDLIISATDPDGGLAGFIRAITDGVYRATIFDLIVRPDHRDAGIGAELIRRAHEHPILAGCRRIELICVEEMAPWYERFGYELAPRDHLRMVWRRPDWS
jgi:GNAT superfamily N-acetyltransferase